MRWISGSVCSANRWATRDRVTHEYAGRRWDERTNRSPNSKPIIQHCFTHDERSSIICGTISAADCGAVWYPDSVVLTHKCCSNCESDVG
jgi:hypothetical protein